MPSPPTTFSVPQARNLYFMLIIYMSFNGFALFFHIIFGHQAALQSPLGQTIL